MDSKQTVPDAQLYRFTCVLLIFEKALWCVVYLYVMRRIACQTAIRLGSEKARRGKTR
jgi:hypothetical protein